jgi:Domain of unknown function (DUF4281)
VNLSPDLVFRLGNGLALLGWVLLAASPAGARWAPWARRLAGRVLPLLFAVVYVALLVQHWPAEGGFGSVAQVQALFAVPGALVAGWLHYLAFDLFVGAWIAERGAALGLPHWQLVPLLLLTFMFGPAGLLAFFALRAVRRPASLSFTSGARG